MLGASRGNRRVSRARRAGLFAALAAFTVASSSACSNASSGDTTGTTSPGAPVTLTLWHNGSLDDTGFGFVKQVAKNFQTAHPGVTIQLVEKPQDNYFALLQTALISNNGPDIADLYTGSYMTRLIPHLYDLNPDVPEAVRTSIAGIQYYSKDGDTKAATYAIPAVNQFYNMWFNQDLFAKAGIKSPPTDWSEMMADCSLLKAKGITPLALGSPTFLTPGGGAVFDWSYLAGGAYPLSDWNKLLSGTLPYSSPALVKQVQSWANLYSGGCTSPSITTQNSDTLFTSGKVAMVMNYNGLYPTYFKALGSKLGVMIPPWSEAPQRILVQLPGAGYGVAKSSNNAKLAAEFVASTVSAESQQLVASSGGLPVIKGVAVNGVMSQLLTWAQGGQYKLYPMFDNFMQQAVVAQLNTQLPEAFVGHSSAADALRTFDQALAGLPDSDRSTNYNLGAG